MRNHVFGHRLDEVFNYIDDEHTLWEIYWDRLFEPERVTKKRLNKGTDRLFNETGDLRIGIQTSCFECLILGLRAGAYLRRLPDE